jgi:ABC-type sugar transport system ATPase subunit
MKILKIIDLVKTQDNSLMLDKINVEIRSGYIYGIISDNAGKLNLLLDILGGLEDEDSGIILLKSRKSKKEERKKRVAIGRSNFKLVDKMSVIDNIFLSSFSHYSIFGFLIDRKSMLAKTNEIFKSLNVAINLKSKLKYLNINEKLIVEIARTLVTDADCYIFSLMTRSLTLRQYDAFISVLRELKNKGKGVIVVPGTAEDIHTFIDKLFLLKNSNLIEMENSRDLSKEKLNELLLSSEKSQFPQVYDPIHRAKMIMEEKINEPDIDIQKIAENVYMGYENFRRRFKLQVGLSPNQYFLRIKMDKAKDLLLYTNMEIKEIAEKLGFSDPFYFSRVFKEKENMAPAKFRGNRLDTFTDYRE